MCNGACQRAVKLDAVLVFAQMNIEQQQIDSLFVIVVPFVVLRSNEPLSSLVISVLTKTSPSVSLLASTKPLPSS